MTIDRTREVQESEFDRITTLTTEAEHLEKKFEEEATEAVMNSKDRGQWLKEIIEDLNIPDSVWDQLFDYYTGNDSEFNSGSMEAAKDGELGYYLHIVVYPILANKLKKEIDHQVDVAKDRHEDELNGWRGE